MMKFFNKIFFLLFILFSSKGFCLKSFQMSDTKPLKRNFSSKTFSKGDKYFQINWYESYYPNLSHYEKTKWKPYAPSFKQPFHFLKKQDAYHRIKKLIDDGVATGVILYMKNNAIAFNIVDSLATHLDVEIYPQLYNKYSKKNFPADKLEDYKIKLLSNKNVNVYFNDDILPENWTKFEVKNFAEILHKNGENKYFLSCSALQNYENPRLNIIDNVDIIAPQLYPLVGRANIKNDLYSTIPKFHNFDKYYLQLIRLKKLVLNYNENHIHKIYEGVTLADYHLNRKNYAVLSRFPTYKEFRYEFYTAIICGAKAINIFADYASNEESYENVKKIIHEFKDTKLGKSVLYGKYNPQAVEIRDNLFQYTIDYCCYIYDKKKYVIISNPSARIQEITLKNNDGEKMNLTDWKSKKTEKNIYQKSFFLKPFEIKIYVIGSIKND